MSIASEEDVVRLVRPDDAPWADTGTGVLLKVLRFDQKHGTWKFVVADSIINDRVKIRCAAKFGRAQLSV